MSKSSKRRALLEADGELDEAGKKVAAARAEIARVASLLKLEEESGVPDGRTQTGG